MKYHIILFANFNNHLKKFHFRQNILYFIYCPNLKALSLKIQENNFDFTTHFDLDQRTKFLQNFLFMKNPLLSKVKTFLFIKVHLNYIKINKVILLWNITKLIKHCYYQIIF